VVLSMIAMLTYSARMHRSPVPVEHIASYWVQRLEQMLAGLVRDREIIDRDRSIDIRFDDFMADDLGTAESVFAIAEEQLSDTERSAMAAYLAGHQRGRLGRVETSCEMFGLDPDDLLARFAPYTQRFLA
jgi:hypothetical protein